MLKLLGCGALTLGALLLCREYCRRLDRSSRTIEAFIGFLRTKARLISTVGEKAAGAAREFLGDEMLCDLAEQIDGGASSSQAFSRCRAAEYLPEGGRRALEKYFDSCGRDYAEAELRLIEDTVRELEELSRHETAERGRRGRTCYAVTLALAAGAIIALL